MRTLQRFMRHFPRHRIALLLASFWLAQVQGIVHEIGHLTVTAHVQAEAIAPPASLCAECLALAQAGAAPVRVQAAVHPLSGMHPEPDASVRDIALAAPCRAFSPRAPPTST
jgi:hypothetical protein